MNLKKCIFLVSLLVLSAVFVFTGCSPEDSAQVDEQDVGNDDVVVDDIVHLRIASFDVGTSFYVVGATIAKVVRDTLPSGSTIDVLPYAGGTGNAELVGKGDSELGVSFSISNRWAKSGVVAYEQAYPNLRSLGGGFGRYFIGAITTKSSGITSFKEAFEEQRPIRLVTHSVGALGEVVTRQILEAYGVTYDDIKAWGGSVEHTSVSVISSQMKDGFADMWIQAYTIGHPTVSELSMTTDLNFLNLEDEIAQKLAEIHGYEIGIPLPANSFKGQPEDVYTATFIVNLIVAEDFPEELAYKFTKALCENKESLVSGHVFFEDFEPEKAGLISNNGIELHPGSARYLEEQGWPTE